MTNPHTELVNNLLIALGARPDLGKFWKRNTGAFKTDEGHYIKYGLEGAPDIEGILVSGRHIEIECKTGTGRLSEPQRNFKAMILKYGGVFIEARGITETLAEVERWVTTL